MPPLCLAVSLSLWASILPQWHDFTKCSHSSCHSTRTNINTRHRAWRAQGWGSRREPTTYQKPAIPMFNFEHERPPLDPLLPFPTSPLRCRTFWYPFQHPVLRRRVQVCRSGARHDVLSVFLPELASGSRETLTVKNLRPVCAHNSEMSEVDVGGG